MAVVKFGAAVLRERLGVDPDDARDALDRGAVRPQHLDAVALGLRGLPGRAGRRPHAILGARAGRRLGRHHGFRDADAARFKEFPRGALRAAALAFWTGGIFPWHGRLTGNFHLGSGLGRGGITGEFLPSTH